MSNKTYQHDTKSKATEDKSRAASPGNARAHPHETTVSSSFTAGNASATANTSASELFAKVNKALDFLLEDSGASATLLADSSGTAIAQRGNCEQGSLHVLSTLAAADYAATVEMARIIGEELQFRSHFYEGANRSLYITGIRGGYFLAVIFSKETNFGLVRVKTAKLVRDLEALFAEGVITYESKTINSNVLRDEDNEEFCNELAERLDKALLSGD